MPRLVKIGMTTNLPEDRAAQLSTTGVPISFTVEAYWQVSEKDLRITERAIHRLLDGHRYSANREFFSLTVAEANRILESYFKRQDDLQRKEQERRKWEEKRKRSEEKLIKGVDNIMERINSNSSIMESYLESILPAASVIGILSKQKSGRVMSFSGWEVRAAFSYFGGDKRPQGLQPDNPKVYVNIPAEVEAPSRPQTWLAWLRGGQKEVHRYGGYFSASYFLYTGELNSHSRERAYMDDVELLKQVVQSGPFPKSFQEFLSKAGLGELKAAWDELFSQPPTMNV